VFQRTRALCRAASFMWTAESRMLPWCTASSMDRDHTSYEFRYRRTHGFSRCDQRSSVTCPRGSVAIAFRPVSKELRTIEWTPCSGHSTPRWHVRRNLPIHQRMRSLSLPNRTPVDGSC
jgi:hypothetical protein